MFHDRLNEQAKPRFRQNIGLGAAESVGFSTLPFNLASVVISVKPTHISAG